MAGDPVRPVHRFNNRSGHSGHSMVICAFNHQLSRDGGPCMLLATIAAVILPNGKSLPVQICWRLRAGTTFSISEFPCYPPYFHLICSFPSCILSISSNPSAGIWPLEHLRHLEPRALCIRHLLHLFCLPSDRISIFDGHLVHLICLVAI